MRGGCWPTAEQTLLLRAVLLDGEAARRALDEWRSRVNLEHLDLGSRRLLPLLRHRTREEGVVEPLQRRAREAFDRASAENAVLLQVAAEAIEALGSAGIDCLVLKGVALVARGLMSPAERPMADCDLLVPEAQALAARDVLTRAGWRLQSRMDGDTLSVRHSVGLRDPSGHQLDLHWHVLADCLEAGADGEFWRSSAPAALDGTPTRTLCAADMVLHACVHGLAWSIVPPVRWAADAMIVIREAGAGFDWERVADQAERRLLVLPVIDTLTYLRDALGAPVPESLSQRLLRVRVPRWARAHHRVRMRPRSRPRQLLYHWFLHRRLNASRTALGSAVRFPSYLRRRFGR